MPHLKGLQQNQLLAILPTDVQQRLYPHMDLIKLSLGEVIYESGDMQRYVYFPTNSVVSLMHVTENGASAEVAVVGDEGLIGASLFIGDGCTTGRALVQSAGNAYRLPGKRLKDEFNLHGVLLYSILRYTQSLMTQMAQTAVCNRHHSIEQRLCRWLLASLDRQESNELMITQELIATMLGVRREGVTEAAGRLQRIGVIEYHRGHIHVLDRTQLETLSCECYAIVRNESQRLLPWISSDSCINGIKRINAIDGVNDSNSVNRATI